jgi:signal transduction histidine kinase
MCQRGHYLFGDGGHGDKVSLWRLAVCPVSWRDMTRRWRWDAALMAGALAAQLAPFLFVPPETPGAQWSILGYGAVALSAVPVLLRRLNPAVLLLVSTLGIAAYNLVEPVPPQPIWYGPLICMYTVAYQSPRWQRIAALAATGVGMLTVIGSVNTAVRELATWSAAYTLGALMRTRQEASAQLAAERERTRIARDLHDILGHAFSLMVVQSETGAALAKHDPGRAEQAFEAIARTGREAMTQLRGTVGSLREPVASSGADLALHTRTRRVASLAPQPGLADLPELVRRTESPGLATKLTETGEPRALSPDVQLAVYRLVQEALTNVVNHSRASEAEVRLEWKEGAFTVSVVDDGVGRGARSTGGHGLDGIRERVTAAGGSVEFGVNGTKGFRVMAAFR